MDNPKICPKVFAIVLNYNGKDVLLQCLESLFRSDYPGLEIVVVDNQSKDGSLESAREKFPLLHFIKNSENLGFAAGNNVGIRFCLEKMADYVFLLNNDALVEPDTISNLVLEAGKDDSIGILSPVILSPEKNKVWFAGGKISWLKMKVEHLTKISSSEPFETGFVSGCAMLIKNTVFKQIGLFDEHFFLYYEDADLSLRAVRKEFKLKIIPSSIAYHHEQSETNNPAKLYWLVFSAILFFRKNSSKLLRFWIEIYLLARRLKNYLDVKFKPTAKSLEVQRAYRHP